MSKEAGLQRKELIKSQPLPVKKEKENEFRRVKEDEKNAKDEA